MIYFACSKGHSLAVPLDLAGRQVKCPLCQEVVQAPAAATAIVAAPPKLPAASPTTADSEEDTYQIATDAPRPPAAEEATERIPLAPPPVSQPVAEDSVIEATVARPKKKERQQLRRVRVGLALHFAKYVCLVIGILLLVLGIILARLTPGLEVLALLGYFSANTAAPVLGIIGSALCVMVPPKSGGRGVIIATLACDAAAFLFGLIGGVAAAVAGGFAASATALAFLLLAGLAGLSGFILFMLFLRSLATYLEEHGRADEAVSLLVLYLIIGFGGFTVLVISASILVPRSDVAAVIVILVGEIALFFAWIHLLFRILALITDLRNRIQPPKPDLV